MESHKDVCKIFHLFASVDIYNFKFYTQLTIYKNFASIIPNKSNK